MFTVIAFSEIHQNAATEDAIAGVPDPTHHVNGDDISVGKFNQIVGAYASGMSIGNARLTSPSLRGKSHFYISPLVNDLGGYGQFTTRHFDDRHDCPLPLTTYEALNGYVEDTIVDAKQNDLIGVFLAEGPLSPVKGEIWTVYATDTDIAAVQKSWVNGEMSWTPDLPVGRYQIVGARCYLQGGGLFRFNFIGGVERPGGICVHEQHLQEDPIFRAGNLGVWGEFDSVNPPSLEVLPQLVAGATGAYLRIDLLKVS